MIRVHLICALADATQADAELTSLWGSDQSGSFSVPLTSQGADAPTHFGCSGLYDAARAQALYAVHCFSAMAGDEMDFETFASSIGFHSLELANPSF